MHFLVWKTREFLFRILENKGVFIQNFVTASNLLSYIEPQFGDREFLRRIGRNQECFHIEELGVTLQTPYPITLSLYTYIGKIQHNGQNHLPSRVMMATKAGCKLLR